MPYIIAFECGFNCTMRFDFQEQNECASAPAKMPPEGAVDKLAELSDPQSLCSHSV